MIEFFRAGGAPMILVLLFGLMTLGAAVWFMAKPAERHIGMIRGFSVATVFSSLAGITAGLAMVFTRVPHTPEWAESPDMPLIVMTGIGESLSPGILGFTLLALAWMVTALGVRRLGLREAT